MSRVLKPANKCYICVNEAHQSLSRDTFVRKKNADTMKLTDNAMKQSDNTLHTQALLLATKALEIISKTLDIIAAAEASGKTYNRVTLQGRTLYKDDAWNTLCLPFGLDQTALAASPLADCTLMELDLTTAFEGHTTGVDG